MTWPCGNDIGGLTIKDAFVRRGSYTGIAENLGSLEHNLTHHQITGMPPLDIFQSNKRHKFRSGVDALRLEHLATDLQSHDFQALI